MYDVNEIRKNFPMLNNKTMQGKPLVFLDNCSTTFKPQCVIDAMNDYYLNYTSNSHRGDYDLCYQVDQKIAEARHTVSKFINCEINEVVFTSGDTLSLNMIAYGYGIKNLKEGDEVLLSESEHASNTLPWFKLKELKNITIKFIPLDEKGKITPENLNKVISSKTKIVSITHVSNVLGYENDVKELAKIVHQNGAIIVVDGAQSVPHMPINFKELDIDFLTFSGHKMCGPTGVGCLIGKKNLLDNIDAFIMGGGDNITFNINGSYELYDSPNKFEAGTLNIAGIIGLKAAIDFLNSIGLENIKKHDQELINYAVSKLENNENVIIYNKDSHSPILTFNIKNIFPQDEATLLNSKGIAIRSGLHCAKMLDGFLKTYATCRMSTYLYTSQEDIDTFIDAINDGGDILDAYFN